MTDRVEVVGEQTNASSRTNAIRIYAARAQGLAEAQIQVDVATFTQCVDAYAQNEAGSPALSERFRAEFKPAVHAWVATRPLESSDAPLTPFAVSRHGCVIFVAKAIWIAAFPVSVAV